MKSLFILLSLAASATLIAQVKVGDNASSINPSSAFEIESADGGFLPPRMTTLQRNAIANPATGLMIFNITTNTINYYNGASWYEMPGKNATLTGTVRNGQGTLVFMAHNLGADYHLDPLVPAAGLNGSYYQFGRPDVVATASTPPGAIVGWNPAYAANDAWGPIKTVNDPCPQDFRVPTLSEWTAVTWYNTTTAVGTWVSSPTNFNSGIYISSGGVVGLFLPAAGSRNQSGALVDRGAVGLYWSATSLQNYLNDKAHTLYFQYNALNLSMGGAEIWEQRRSTGLPIRCIKE